MEDGIIPKAKTLKRKIEKIVLKSKSLPIDFNRC